MTVVRNVKSPSDLMAMDERPSAEFGRIQIPVNNAGIHRAALPLDVTEQHCGAITTVNAKAAIFASQAVLPPTITELSQGRALHADAFNGCAPRGQRCNTMLRGAATLSCGTFKDRLQAIHHCG